MSAYAKATAPQWLAESELARIDVSRQKMSAYAKATARQWLAESELARIDVSRQKNVRLRQGYGATVYAIVSRRQRRLEARGFEPLTSSLQSWRSTN